MKYIIEADERSELVQVISVMPNGTVYTNEKSIDELEELTSDYINEHYGQLQDDAYQRGLEDGKAVHGKGCEGCKYSGTPQGSSPCFNCSNYYQNNWTAKDDRIEVGDEVECVGEGWKAVATKIDSDMELVLMGDDGSIAHNYRIEDFVKTGRHFDIASILEDMRK